MHSAFSEYLFSLNSNDEILLSAGGEIRGQGGQDAQWKRFAVIVYDNSHSQFVFSARRWSDPVSSYICQLQQGLSFTNLILLKIRYEMCFKAFLPFRNNCVINS